MKKIAVLVVAVAVFFVSSGPILACSLCEALRSLGYTNTQISQAIRSSANRAEAETKMRQLIVEGRPVKINPQPPAKTVEVPAVKAESLRQDNQNQNPFTGQYTWNGKIED